MKISLRIMDTAARIGGEEFAIILPECAPEDAIHAAKRIHSGLNPLGVHVHPHSLQLTTSAGLVKLRLLHKTSAFVARLLKDPYDYVFWTTTFGHDDLAILLQGRIKTGMERGGSRGEILQYATGFGVRLLLEFQGRRD
jgi:predicted signal transduction protein with EAL and GGDEF domain